MPAFHTIRGDAVAVRRVVVVERARRVHIANIVRVADVRGTQPPKQRFYNRCPIFYRAFPIQLCAKLSKGFALRLLSLSSIQYVLFQGRMSYMQYQSC